MVPVQQLESLRARYRELEDLLCQPEVAADGARFTKLSRERGELSSVVEIYEQYEQLTKQIEEDRAAVSDPELRELALEELPGLEESLVDVENQLAVLLLPKDPNDARNTLLEIRAGTGGEEAALFAADLFRMYCRFAESRRWKVEMLSSSLGASGGFKEVVALIAGERVYSVMRFEGGVHRVQRVPQTEAQGRVHTSTATVAVLPEADEDDDVEIKTEDLRVDTYRASGAGGQHINKTESAVRLTHLPTGIVVACQAERSQHKNRATAMKVLKARLLEKGRGESQAAEAQERRDMVGSGDRAEKIRTYNFPQNRVTDHRLGLTLHKLESIVEGDLDELFTALSNHREASLMAEQSKR